MGFGTKLDNDPCLKMITRLLRWDGHSTQSLVTDLLDANFVAMILRFYGWLLHQS